MTVGWLTDCSLRQSLFVKIVSVSVDDGDSELTSSGISGLSPHWGAFEFSLASLSASSLRCTPLCPLIHLSPKILFTDNSFRV